MHTSGKAERYHYPVFKCEEQDRAHSHPDTKMNQEQKPDHGNPFLLCFEAAESPAELRRGREKKEGGCKGLSCTPLTAAEPGREVSRVQMLGPDTA